jgi:hypothetical protein
MEAADISKLDEIVMKFLHKNFFLRAFALHRKLFIYFHLSESQGVKNKWECQLKGGKVCK